MVIRVNKLLRFFGHAPDVNALSAQLDGQLDAVAASRLAAHLASCEACRAALAGLRETRDALRAMPELEAPRSFRLRAADVEPRTAPAPSHPSPTLRWAPAVSAIAAAVFVVALGVDLRSGGSSSSTSRSPLAVPQSGSAKSNESAGAMSGSPATDQTAPGSIEPGAPAAARPQAPEPAGAAQATLSAQPVQPSSTPAPAARPIPSPTSELRAAAGRGGSSEGGNNPSALRVLEIIAGAIAVAGGAAAIVVRRRRGVGP